jgi:hypothetical protein
MLSQFWWGNLFKIVHLKDRYVDVRYIFQTLREIHCEVHHSDLKSKERNVLDGSQTRVFDSNLDRGMHYSVLRCPVYVASCERPIPHPCRWEVISLFLAQLQSFNPPPRLLQSLSDLGLP